MLSEGWIGSVYGMCEWEKGGGKSEQPVVRVQTALNPLSCTQRAINTRGKRNMVFYNFILKTIVALTSMRPSFNDCNRVG